MKILYIFPHPDDESFGPAGAIHQQVSNGHDVHLLTLTKGGATQVRLKMKLSLQRLAFFTMPDDSRKPSIQKDGWPRLKLSEESLIDCVTPLKDEDIQKMKDALLCYESYQEMVTKIGVIEKIGRKVHFEIAFEDHKPALSDITHGIAVASPPISTCCFPNNDASFCCSPYPSVTENTG